MAWKLHLRNENYRGPAETRAGYVSRTDALKGAYLLIIHPSLGKKPVLIEGPDGQRIDEDAIDAWCREYGAGAGLATGAPKRFFNGTHKR